MSSTQAAPLDKWYLPGMQLALRNNQTTFVLVEVNGAGYRFDMRGFMEKLTAKGEVSGLVGAGTWTVTITVYSGGTAAANKVYELVFTGTVNGSFSNTDVTADGGGPGPDYGTGTDVLIKAVSNMGTFTGMSVSYNLLLEGRNIG